MRVTVVATSEARSLGSRTASFFSIARTTETVVTLCVPADFPAKTIAEFVALMKAEPNRKFSFGSPGAGTLTHLTGEIYKRAVGLPDYAHIPYRGAGPGMNDLVGGQLPVSFDTLYDEIRALARIFGVPGEAEL